MGLGAIKRKNSPYSETVEIGAWDMDTDLLKSVAHNLGSRWTKVKSMKLMIMKDDENLQVDYLVGGADRFSITSTNILLGHPIGSVFDSADYSGTSINRGDIVLELEP